MSRAVWWRSFHILCAPTPIYCYLQSEWTWKCQGGKVYTAVLFYSFTTSCRMIYTWRDVSVSLFWLLDLTWNKKKRHVVEWSHIPFLHLRVETQQSKRVVVQFFLVVLLDISNSTFRRASPVTFFLFFLLRLPSPASNGDDDDDAAAAAAAAAIVPTGAPGLSCCTARSFKSLRAIFSHSRHPNSTVRSLTSDTSTSVVSFLSLKKR